MTPENQNVPVCGLAVAICSALRACGELSTEGVARHIYNLTRPREHITPDYTSHQYIVPLGEMLERCEVQRRFVRGNHGSLIELWSLPNIAGEP